jgi:hypothetical protein
MDSADDNIVSLLGELAFCTDCPPLESDAVLPKNWILRMRRRDRAKVEARAAIQHPFSQHRRNSSALNEISVRMVRVTRDEAQSQDQVA